MKKLMELWKTGLKRRRPALPARVPEPPLAEVCPSETLRQALFCLWLYRLPPLAGCRVLLREPPPTVALPLSELLAAKDCELLLQMSARHTAENIAHRIYHQSGRVVQPVLRGRPVSAELSADFSRAEAWPPAALQRLAAAGDKPLWESCARADSQALALLDKRLQGHDLRLNA